MTLILQTVHKFFDQQVLGLHQDFNEWRSRLRRTVVGMADLVSGRLTVERNETKAKVRLAAIGLSLGLFLYALGQFIPEGFDWKCCFKTRVLPPFFVPWTLPLLPLLNPALLFTLTVLGIVIRMRRYHSSVWRIGLALISLPTLWLLFLGNIDGLVLIGLCLLPIGVPLVLIKPQVASFALLANRRSILATVIWVAISFLIWGIWPLLFLGVGTAQLPDRSGRSRIDHSGRDCFQHHTGERVIHCRVAEEHPRPEAAADRRFSHVPSVPGVSEGRS